MPARYGAIRYGSTRYAEGVVIVVVAQPGNATITIGLRNSAGLAVKALNVATLTAKAINTVVLTFSVAGMATTDLDIGDIVTVDVEFKNESGALTDPTTITFSMQQPDGAITNYVYGTAAEVTKTAVGKYRLQFEALMCGAHVCRVVGTGTLKAAQRESFTVRSKF